MAPANGSPGQPTPNRDNRFPAGRRQMVNEPFQAEYGDQPGLQMDLGNDPAAEPGQSWTRRPVVFRHLRTPAGVFGRIWRITPHPGRHDVQLFRGFFTDPLELAKPTGADLVLLINIMQLHFKPGGKIPRAGFPAHVSSGYARKHGFFLVILIKAPSGLGHVKQGNGWGRPPE